MIERAPGIFEVELHSGQLSISEIKIFIVKGTEGGRSLMVDAGFRNRDCLRVMEGVLEELGIRYDQLDIFLTHKHHDHCGLASVYAERGARLFLNRLEDRHCYDCLYYSHSHGAAEDQPQVLRSVGVTPQDTPEVWEMFMEINRRAEGEKGWEFDIPGFYYTPASAGDTFCYGNYRFEAVELSGHTYGQLGLYDADKKVLFIADQVINGIVPIVGTSYPDEGLLARYFKSLEYIKHHYTDCLVLPAHNGPVTDLAGTVNRIVFSYLDKADMIRSILVHGRRAMTTQEVARLAYGMERVPADQAQFIKLKMVISKTFSCLEYLYEEDFALRTERDGVFYWEAP